MYIYIYIHIHTYVYISIYMHTHVSIYIYMNMWLRSLGLAKAFRRYKVAFSPEAEAHCLEPSQALEPGHGIQRMNQEHGAQACVLAPWPRPRNQGLGLCPGPQTEAQAPRNRSTEIFPQKTQKRLSLTDSAHTCSMTQASQNAGAKLPKHLPQMAGPAP